MALEPVLVGQDSYIQIVVANFQGGFDLLFGAGVRRRRQRQCDRGPQRYNGIFHRGCAAQ